MRAVSLALVLVLVPGGVPVAADAPAPAEAVAAGPDIAADEPKPEADPEAKPEPEPAAEDDAPIDTTGANPSALRFTELVSKALGAAFAGAEIDPSEFADEEEPLSPLLGAEAPAFELEMLLGEKLRSEDLRGKVVVLDFWATWCGPCVRAMTQVEKLHQQVDGARVLVFGVNQSEERDDVLEFLEGTDFTFPHVLDIDGKVGDAFGASSIPHTVVIDAKGVVQSIHSGFSPTLGKELARDVERVLAGETLYDAKAVAAAQAEREERAEELRKIVGPVAEERLELVETVRLPDVEAYFDDAAESRGANLPDGASHALLVGGNRLVVLTPNGAEPRVLEFDWGIEAEGEVRIDGARGVASDEGPQWVVHGTLYDEDQDVAGLVVGLFDHDAERVWVRELPCPGEWGSFKTAVDDLDGDGQAEVVTLAEHYGPFEPTGEEGYLHVLSVYDGRGELAARRWLSGDDGTGVFVVERPEGPCVLVNVDDGLAFYRLRAE